MQKRILVNPILINLLVIGAFFAAFKPAYGFDSSDNTIAQNIIFLKKEDQQKNIIGGKFIGEVFNNYHKSDDEYNENYANTRLDLNAKLGGNFLAKSILKFEQIRPATDNNFGSNNRSFQNEGAFVEELALNYDQDKFSLLAGKFTLDFANGWKFQNGIWNSDLAKENYRFSEKIGGAAFIKGGNRNTFGQYVVSFASFNNDRKYLANSIITNRDVASKSDAAPGDKGGLQSFNTSLNVLFDFGNKEELTYHLSYVNLAVNDKQSALPQNRSGDQKGYAANMNYKYPYSKNLLIDGFVEFVSFENVGGDKDKEALFFTSNLTLNLYKNWVLTAARTREGASQVGVEGITTKITEYSGGYKFTENSILNGLQILVGYKENKIDDKINKVNNNAIGVLARYVKQF